MGDRARPQVFVYCDDPSHGGRVAVTAFCPDRDRWEEWRASSNRRSGLKLVDHAPTTANGDRLDLPRYRLECGKCGDRTAAVLQGETLFGVLDALADHDLSHITLAALAAAAEYISTTSDS